METLWEKQNRVLHSPFDAKTHKETFIDYLEVVIDSEGVIHYAVPSHNGFMEMQLLKLRGIEFDYFNYYDKVSDLCPENRYADYFEWLCEETGCIPVWGLPRSVYLGKPNEKQLASIEMLKKEGLF